MENKNKYGSSNSNIVTIPGELVALFKLLEWWDDPVKRLIAIRGYLAALEWWNDPEKKLIAIKAYQATLEVVKKRKKVKSKKKKTATKKVKK